MSNAESITPPSLLEATFPLQTPGGGVVIAAGAAGAISVADVSRFGYLRILRAFNTVAGAAGSITLRSSVGGATLEILELDAASPGDNRNFEFPVPWKTLAVNAQFELVLAAGVGTWRFSVNGFRWHG